MSKLRLIVGAFVLGTPGIAYAHGTEGALYMTASLLAQPAIFWVLDIWARETQRPRWAAALILACCLAAVLYFSTTEPWMEIVRAIWEWPSDQALMTQAGILALAPFVMAWSVMAILFKGKPHERGDRGETA